MTLPLFPERPPDGAGDRPDQPRRGGEARTVSLVRLSAEIARSMAAVGRVAVEGEVHRPTRTGSGRVYFTLRDRAAQVSVMCPRAKVPRCRTVAGERVCVVGALNWINERGELLLVAEEVTPVGDGAVAAMIAESRRRLQAEGLLDRPRRRLPRLPELIGVVCGAEAAVRKDIESVVAARFPGYPITFAETMVSGPGAAVSILEALQRLAQRPGVEVIILARGGGDATQLLPWSDEELCRAICACPVPVVSAIGHDADCPLSDDVADLRCGTPSLAAGAVVPDRLLLVAELNALHVNADAALRRHLERGARRLATIDTGRAAQAAVALAAGRVTRAGDRLVLLHPRRQVAEAHRRLASVDWATPAAHRLARAAGRLDAADWRRPLVSRVARAAERVAADGRHLTALSPVRVLERGFAVVRRTDGTVVRAAGQLTAGDGVDVQLAKGRLAALVQEVGDE
jgi:exodeoxyribonuclease VII large subunit